MLFFHNLYEITKKASYLLLAALFINSVSAIEAKDTKNVTPIQSPSGYRHFTQIETDYARYSNFSSAPASRTFDYDPGLLPEVAEVFFVLRIKHANIDKPFVVNLSGNYLLKFTKYLIYLLDTYTKNSDVYEYQSTNPNITIGLGVSKGLPRNYKSIVIKEDAYGQLYDYAALHSDNISTDETMLSETLSHPFYQIAGQDGVEDQVKVTKAMTFYRKSPSHERHARCVKSSSTIIKQLMEILSSGNPVCEPKAGSDIFVANQKSIADMKLDQQLVEADVNKSKYPYTVGHHLQVILDLKGKNTVALLIAALSCKMSVLTLINNHRKKRAPGDCAHWTELVVRLYMSLGLPLSKVYEIVEIIKHGFALGSAYFPGGQYPPETDASRETLRQLILEDPNKAIFELQLAAGLTGDAATGGQLLSHNNQRAPLPSEIERQNAAASARLAVYTLNKQQFNPLPNTVRILNNNLEPEVLSGRLYTTTVIPVYEMNEFNIKEYLGTLKNWENHINEMIKNAENAEDKAELERGLDNVMGIRFYLLAMSDRRTVDNGLIISVIYSDRNLIGISIGAIYGRVYQVMSQVVSPNSILNLQGSYSGALAYLASETLKKLFSRGLIDSSRAYVITNDSAKPFLNLGFRHDEL